MYIGIDIGGTNIKHGLIDNDGAIISKGKITTNHNKELLLDDIERLIEIYVKENGIIGIGISAPGIIKENGYMVTAGSIKPLYGTNLKNEVETRTSLPTHVMNDGNAVAIAEKWLGNGQSFSHYICVVLGTGMGGGIVINNELYSGAHGMAGEFGYMIIEEPPLAGNIETASLNWKAAVVGGLCANYNQSIEGHASKIEPTYDAQEIMIRADQNDVFAKKALDRFYQDIAIGLLNLVSVFDPEVILLGGGISDNQDFVAQLINAFQLLQSKHDSINFLMDKTIAKVMPAKLTNDAGMIGAVYQLKKSLRI